MTDIRDTNQPETANDEFENLGEWTLVEQIRIKSRPVVQSKRPRETLADLEHMESDELQRYWEQAAVQTREKVTRQRIRQ